MIDRGERGHQFGGGRLRSLDAETGERRWDRPVGDEGTSPVAAREGVVVVTGTDGTHAFEPATGDRRWLSDAFHGPPVLAGDRVYGRRTAGDFVDTVVAADLATGEPVDSYTFDFQLNRPPVFARGRAFAHALEFDDSGERGEHVADRIHALG